MVWNEVIVGYLFLAGMGAGSAAYGILAGWKDPEARKLKMAGLCIGFIAVAAGTLLLMVDAKAGLLNPLRFLLLFSNFGSVMTWGTLILSAFLIVGFIEILLVCSKKSTPKILDWITIVLSVCVAVYTGVLLGVSGAYPLWNIAILPLLFLVSAASTGFAATQLAGCCIDRASLSKEVLPAATHVVLPVAEAVLIVILLAITSTATGPAAEAASATVTSLLFGAYAPLFWAAFVLAGLVIPFCIALIVKKAQTTARFASVLGWVCVLVGGFALRYLVVMAALPIVSY